MIKETSVAVLASEGSSQMLSQKKRLSTNFSNNSGYNGLSQLGNERGHVLAHVDGVNNMRGRGTVQ